MSYFKALLEQHQLEEERESFEPSSNNWAYRDEPSTPAQSKYINYLLVKTQERGGRRHYEEAVKDGPLTKSKASDLIELLQNL